MAKGSWFGPDSGDKDGCCPLIYAVAVVRVFPVSQLRQELEGLRIHELIDRVASYLGLRSVHVSVFVTLWDRSHDADALEMLQRMADECGTAAVDPARAANGKPGNRALLVEEEEGVLVGA